MTAGSPTVRFVSKTIAPPWNDGSKVLVRDLLTSLPTFRSQVYAENPHPSWGPLVEVMVPARGASQLRANLGTFGKLLLDAPPEVFHFVFAPNLPSSTAARIVALSHRVRGWNGCTVQTIASRPKDFANVRRLLFGDVIVCQSQSTRDACVHAGVAAERLRIVPPFIVEPHVTPARMADFREKNLLGRAPYLLYAGDLEVSDGAWVFARSIRRISDEFPRMRFVFACRPKTPRAAEVQRAIAAELARANLAHLTYNLGEVSDVHALIAAAEAVLFPVNDLYGKIDLPLILLEAMALGVPVLASNHGPLADLAPMPLVPPSKPDALAELAVELLRKPGEKFRVGHLGRKLFEERYTAASGARAYEQVYREGLFQQRG